MVSTHLKNISQNGNLPQIGVNIKNIWNHHPGIHASYFHRTFLQNLDQRSRQKVSHDWIPTKNSRFFEQLKPTSYMDLYGTRIKFLESISDCSVFWAIGNFLASLWWKKRVNPLLKPIWKGSSGMTWNPCLGFIENLDPTLGPGIMTVDSSTKIARLPPKWYPF